MEAHEPQHDEINLVRLVRRLEKSVSNQQEWHGSERKEYTWLKAQNGLQVRMINFLEVLGSYPVQRLKFARNLLKNVELYDYDAPPYVFSCPCPSMYLTRLRAVRKHSNATT